jgi:ketosteroid isomerase-like protein
MASTVEIHRVAHDAFNARDWERIRSITAREVTYVDHAQGRTMRSVDEFVGWLGEWVAGMSDARVTSADYLEAEEHSIARFTGRGTNDGPLGPAQATGRQIEVRFCEILRVRDDRVVAGEMFFDAMTMFAQLGVVEAPAPAA